MDSWIELKYSRKRVYSKMDADKRILKEIKRRFSCVFGHF